ncbi:MAG TPA: iron ABC transporter permease [Gammaproteobacteria bacterium]|jgi:iron complex transport system permease protein|nr:iron ABC transporter permease [Gammaproteobacteria bacterium]
MRQHTRLLSLLLTFTLTCVVFALLSGNNLADPLAFLQLRLPRVLAALVCGGLLALAGTLMQLLLQNPLADPYVLGTSSGAALATLLLMLFGINETWFLGGAWLGSLLTIFLIFLLAKKQRYATHALLLAGIAITCGLSAIISCILLLTPHGTLRGMLFWLTGDLNGVRMPWLESFILLAGFSCCWLLAPGLNVLCRGEIAARALGLPSEQYRLILYILGALFTAAAVTLAGCIGFIGLIVPHLTRRLVGFDHRIVLPVSLLLGGSLLLLADTLARSLLAPMQLPIGMLLAMIGAPVFIGMLYNRTSS